MSTERKQLEILLAVTRDGAFANLALKEGLSGVRANEVGRSTALIYECIEHINYCDFIIDSYAKGRLHTAVRGILRIAMTELFFMHTPDHAVCSKAVKLTEEIGKGKLKGFVNGVIRSVIRARDEGKLPELPEDPIERLEIETGCPAFMLREYSDEYGLEFTREMIGARVRGVCVRAVPPASVDVIAAAFDQRGLSYRRSALLDDALVVDSFGGAVSEDELFVSGSMTIQSESAMLACRCADPKPGMRVLDACAAPGGKTAYMADLMERRGSLCAWDIHPHRVELIRANLDRLGVGFVTAEVRDASVFYPELEGKFDVVLCDVPCSGLGFGSKPDALLRRTDESIEELSRLQYSILETCSRYLDERGTLTYSTCTLSKREDEAVIERFLKEHPDFGLVSLADMLPDTLRERGDKGMLRLLPNVDKTEGFFIAKLGRKNGR